MSKIFKPTITPKLLKILHRSVIGQNIKNTTDLTVESILEYCFLEQPIEDISGLSWLITWDPRAFIIKAEYIYQVQILLKQAWILYSEDEYESERYGLVMQELSKFETEELCIAGQNDIKKCNRQIKKKQNKIEEYQFKIEKRRLKCVKSAQEKRPRRDLDDWIENEIEELPKIKNKELWDKLPGREQNSSFYLEEEKIYFLSEKLKPKSIQYQAFCNHIKFIRKKIQKM